jgi:formylglycine-generating enzyme required for sulfatase activity
MGKFEVSRDMIAKANAPVASGGGNLGITLRDMTLLGGNVPSHPANGVSWNEAARFVNWLNTSQGYTPAYKFIRQPGDDQYIANQNVELWVSGDAGYNAANPFRNILAHYFLPSVDEWYKAAYYDPANGVYYDYPAGSITPTPVPSGTTSGTAVYRQFTQGPADITLAGGLSPYGTMGQGGNVAEWEETEFNLLNHNGSDYRGVRGGDWRDSGPSLAAWERKSVSPGNEPTEVGFRVASVIPEPSTLLLGALAAGVFLAWRRPQESRATNNWEACELVRPVTPCDVATS